MKKQIIFVLAMVAVSAVPTWAIRPEKPLTSIHSLSTRGIITTPAGAGGHAGLAAQLPEKNGKKGTVLGNSKKAWQEFIGRTGKGWSVQWNPTTRTPRLVTGRTMALPGVKRLTRENIKAACLDFVGANAELLKVRSEQLQLSNAVKAGGRWYVSFRQIHQGVPVLSGRLSMSFTKDDRLIMFGSDVYPDVVVETKPKVDRKEAMRLARADCKGTAGNDRVSEVQLCILPVRRAEHFNYLLCWKLYIFQPTIHKKWEYLIDAMNGRVLSKRNALIYQNITGTVRGEYKPEFGGEPTEVTTFPHEDVSARGPDVVIASWDFDSDPGWGTEGQWAFGVPTGGGGNYFGNADPTSGYTGSNVYGVNLNGDYDLTAGGPWYLTTGPINCSGYSNVWLKFWRWLNTDYQPYVSATVEVSNDGSSWTTVWENGSSSVSDSVWGRCKYDISSIADNQPTVYIRWGYEIGFLAWAYSGWNIDDVKVVLIQGGSNTVQTQMDGTYSVVPPWNPCTITSEFEGLYCDISYSCGPDALFEQPGVHPLDVVDFTWNSAWYNEIVEPSVYRHVTYVHDYYVGMDASLSEPSGSFPSGLDYPMPVTVQLGCPDGYCNAYWDGEGMAFGAGDGWFCDDFGLYAEVVYHEYTHGVTSKIYDGVYFPYVMESGAMDEAWSDYFGCGLSLSQDPLVGDGGLLLGYPEGFRSLDNTYRRETDFSNGVHFDSQMLSGALWEARQVIGASVMDEMVHFARYAHAQTFEEYALAILVEDDTRYGDSDLSNGSPHAEAIYTAFGNHGIGGLQYVGPSIVVNDANSNANGKLDPGETVNLSVTLANGWANATDVQAVLSTTDSFVTIVKGVANFPAPNHGDSVDNSADAFIVSLNSGCPETYTINFALEVSTEGPYSYSRTCLFTYAVAVNQLAYDDGQVDDAYIGYGAPGGGLAVRMTPQTYPCYLTHVRLFTNPFGSSTIAVTVWDDDGPEGLPGTVLGSVSADVSATGDWFDVDISSLGLIVDSGSFYAGWVEGGTIYYNGMDFDPPYYERTWVYYYAPPFFDDWVPFEDMDFLANLMVRVRYSDEAPFIINPPYEYSWPLGRPLLECLSASNGMDPYHDWVAVALPSSEYTYSVLGSSLFSPSGIAQGWNTDDYSWSYTLPFSFPYFGSTYNSVNICSNGFLNFTGPSSDFFNSTEELINNVRIAPLWDDLRTDDNPGDDIYIDESMPGQVMIRWQGTTYATGGAVNFAVVLFEDGSIRFDYDGGNINLTPTVGISAGNGTNYVLVPGYDGATSLTNVNSVLFSPASEESPLPPGIALDTDTGCLSGIPTAFGQYATMIQVSDSSEPPATTEHRFDFNILLPTLVFGCDFEEGLCGFAIDNNFGDGGGLWHLTTSCQSDLSGHTTPTSLFYGVDAQCNYDAGLTEGTVTSPVISLPAASEMVILSFKYYLETGYLTNWDIATVEVSENGGSFTAVASNSDGTLTDPMSRWMSASVNLSAMAGSDIQIRFGFRTVDNVANLFAGFYVDDVEIRSDIAVEPPIEVPMKFTPQALNPGSKGKWVKAHFVLPEGFGIDDVDANAPVTVEPLGIESDYVSVFINEDGLVEIEAAFNRADFCAGTNYGPAEVMVVGLLTSGRYFYGSDTIRIITNNLKYLAVLASHWLEAGCGVPDWCGGVDLDRNSVVDFVDFALFDGCCIEVIKK